jgi:hypothetical protein
MREESENMRLCGDPFLGDPGSHVQSKWDEDLLNVELHNVRIQSESFSASWEVISIKYFVRANLYWDSVSDSDSGKFDFNKDKTTGKELMEAFLAAYPTYTCTQDRETGVMWIHRKSVKYEDILGQKVRINQSVIQAPFYTAVLEPLSGLLSGLSPSTTMFPLSFGSQAFNYGIDLPKSVYSIRQILNLSCVANPTVEFRFWPDGQAAVVMMPTRLEYPNPLAPPRATAVRFWEIEIGASKSTNGVPSAEEIGAAMSDPNPRKRWAARVYFEATLHSYQLSDIVGNGEDPERAVWAALGLEAATHRGSGDDHFFDARNLGKLPIKDYLPRLKDPGVALLASLELAREKSGSSYLDEIVNGHKFTEAEIVPLLPDICRMAHGSGLVLAKLKTMKFDVPELSEEALRAMDYSNLLTLVPAGEK